MTFNRPEKLNALSRDLLAQSIDTLKSWSTDSEVGAIVVTGNGRAFCAGGDVSMMNNEGDAALTLEQRIDGLREVQSLSWLLYNIPKVTIAAVNGFAMGAALEYVWLAICGYPPTRRSSERPMPRSASAVISAPPGC
jgi:enoyl-CoA hydratase/carnithine racemase